MKSEALLSARQFKFMLLEDLCALRRSQGRVMPDSPRNFVVLAPGNLPLCFDILVGKVTLPRVTSLDLATRFTPKDAAAVAAVTFNGADEPAEAVTESEAYSRLITEKENLLAVINQRIAALQESVS